MAKRTVAVVGGGFSGTLVALHLLRQDTAAHVVLLEREHEIGRGTAYSSRNLNHRLNVPAGRMSAFADTPNDFLDWLGSQDHGGGPGDFVPRWIFGCYVQQRLDEAAQAAPNRLERVQADVTAVSMAAGEGQLHRAEGDPIRADQIVLALGNQRPQHLPMAHDEFLASPLYCCDPWSPHALDGLAPDAAVLLVGTGLTMVDVVISLLDAGHRGPIQAISRRGLLPHAHVPVAHGPAPAAGAAAAGLSGQLRQLRRDVQAATQSGLPWQSVMDGVRHRTQEIWRALSLPERSRFLRHTRPWWDIHRHRIAPAVAARIDQARASGQLRITAGRIMSLAADPTGLNITYTPRGEAKPAQARVARTINCTGPACDVRRSDDPLIRSLLEQGLAEPDELHLGFNVNPQGEVVGSAGIVTPNLYAIGPVTKGTWWEITAVPDIRQHCARLARHIADHHDQVGG